VVKPRAVDRVYAEVRELIVSGAMAPGSPLIDQRVADAVGGSRTTVRTALEQLRREGFVHAASIGDHHSRFFVGALTVEEMREWYWIFGAVDGLAARGAAMLPERERVRVADRVRELALAHLEAGEGEDPPYDRIQEIDAALHATYVAAGAGPILRQHSEALRPHVDRYGKFYATALIRNLPGEIYHEHCTIAAAIAAGDPELAERAGEANWRNASERFENVMRRVGERGNWGQGSPERGEPARPPFDLKEQL
jgi:DNA-binding GntR family transcriptional regulator